MKYIHVYALLLMLVFHTSCEGQNKPDLAKDNIKSETKQDNISKGLYSEFQVKEAATSKVPMSMVRNVKQARNGDILIASYLGVFRYDGTYFTNLTSKIISPPFSSFWDVLEDRKGNLWFASKDSGVYYYNGKSFQHFTTKDGLASNQAFQIYEDKTGNIWVGPSRYDGKSFRNLNAKDGFPSNSFRLILEDKSGKLWFGSGGNTLIYDGKTFTTLTNKDGKAFKNVRCIIEDKKGNILFSNDDGLWRYDPSTSLRAGGSTFTNFSQRGAFEIIEDKKGNIWTTGEVNPQVWALSRYDAKSLYNKMPTVTEIKSGRRMDFLGILEANDGSIWFGAAGPESGVHRYDGKTITHFKSKEGQK